MVDWLTDKSLTFILLIDWTIRELAMYDLPALVKETCRLSGYEKVCRPPWRSYIAFGSLSIQLHLFMDRLPLFTLSDSIHRSLPGQRLGIHLALAWYPARSRQLSFCLHRSCSRCFCWASHDWVPLHSLGQDGMEGVEKTVRRPRLYSRHDMGVRLCTSGVVCQCPIPFRLSTVTGIGIERRKANEVLLTVALIRLITGLARLHHVCVPVRLDRYQLVRTLILGQAVLDPV